MNQDAVLKPIHYDWGSQRFEYQPSFQQVKSDLIQKSNQLNKAGKIYDLFDIINDVSTEIPLENDY